MTTAGLADDGTSVELVETQQRIRRKLGRVAGGRASCTSDDSIGAMANERCCLQVSGRPPEGCSVTNEMMVLCIFGRKETAKPNSLFCAPAPLAGWFVYLSSVR